MSESNSREAAKELGKLGAAKGGRARANILTKEERSSIAREAARRRWIKAGTAKQIESSPQQSPEAGPDAALVPFVDEMPYSMLPGVLTIGDIDLEVHVLNNLKRVLTQREVVRVISGGRESGNLGRYLERNPLTANNFDLGPTLQFKIPGTGLTANGFEATVLVEICQKYLEAREQGLLRGRQLLLAKQAEIVVRACAKVGIIALIDEATGYQKIRADRDLQLKLQAFIADDMQEWARMFAPEFWIELARLEGIHYSPRSRPLRWGKYIMAFVYDAIDKDVGNELRKKNPNPKFLQNHHQWLKEFGRQKVHDQVTRVITIMKLCENMDEFRSKFKKLFKKPNDQMLFWDGS